MTAPYALKLDALEALPHTPASDVKKLGWRGVMKAMARHGKVLVTNHNEPEAVILPVEEYTAIMNLLRDAAARDEAVVETLRRRFDERLANLKAPDAGEKLADLLRRPLNLEGRVIAGEGH